MNIAEDVNRPLILTPGEEILSIKIPMETNSTVRLLTGRLLPEYF